MTPVQRVAADLTYLADRYEDFHDARLKGTSRPWQQPNISPSGRAANDSLARAERADRTFDAIGEHPAPLHVDVFDALVDLLHTAEELAEQVAQEAGVDRLPYPTSAMADPTPYLRHTAAWLHAVGYQTLEDVAREVTRLRTTVDRHLGELTTGQTLKTVCGWCNGGVAGGAFTYRIREVQGEAHVVCESGVCEPPDADCGTWHRGNPAWSIAREGEWLADRIARVEAARDESAA